MANSKTKSFSGHIKLLMDKDMDFSQKLKEHLVFKSDKISNTFDFIGGLLAKGALSDGSKDLEANFGLKEMVVRLAMMITCSKGAEGIGGLMEALEESGNSLIISELQAWVKRDFGIETERDLGEPDRDAAAPTPKSNALAPQVGNIGELSSCGTKLINKIMTRVDYDFMEQLHGHLVGKASSIINVPEFHSSLVREKVLDGTEMQLATGSQAHWGQPVEKFVKAACAKKAIGSLVVALQNSNNESILAETSEWFESSQARQKNYPISVKSLARQRRSTATGIFAATERGLISLDLQTLKATVLRSEPLAGAAVAVNHKLKKVYWTTSSYPICTIRRSNLDGSGKEIIVQQKGSWIPALAIDNASGNVYFARYESHEIQCCNAVGGNCSVIISNSALVHSTIVIALDSEKGLMFWYNRESPHTLFRANLDGSNAKAISTGFQDLCGITLGQRSSDVLYWVDWEAKAIGTIDVNGRNKRVLVGLEGDSLPWGIQVDAQKIYCSKSYSDAIQSVDRDSGNKGHPQFVMLNWRLLKKSEKIIGL